MKKAKQKEKKKENKENKENKKAKESKTPKSLRRLISLIIFIVVLVTTLLTAGSYYLFIFVGLIPEGTVMSIWIPVIMYCVFNIVGAGMTSLFSSYFLKPIDETIDALRKFSQGDFSVCLEPRRRELKNIRVLRESVNKTAQELGSTEVMRDDFINIISHEYKTPVASILGYAKILKNPEISDEQKQEYTDIIIDESRRLSTMTNNILLLTKYENTQIIPDKKPYPLDEQLRSCVQLLSAGWLEKDINIEGDLSPAEYNGNEDLMAQLWINLLENAIKYTPCGGTVSVSLTDGGSDITVEISDTGCGIAEQDLEHIFDRFYRADKSRGEGGNGLGLSIVKRLVDLCGGEITVKSVPGEGSAFTVVLPKEY